MLTLEAVEIQVGNFRLSADLSVQSGQNVAVIGPSGGGKSTLLAAIAGFISPSKGKVCWNGRDLGSVAPGKRPITALFQDNNLFPHLSAAQNVGLGLRPDLRLSAQQTDDVSAALARVGLTGFEDRKPKALSGGQIARVALARALIRARPILLLDEPFSALGPALKREMLHLVAHVADATNATVLMVTHDPEDARRASDQTILVVSGQAHEPRQTPELFANPPDELRTYLGV